MVLAAFLVGLGASLAGGSVAVVRAIGLWRQTKRTGSTFARELSSFEERSARAERHLAEWERSNQELERALERLRMSRARLRVLQDALEQAQGRMRWLRVFLP
jgi:exonuclease VII small subunit